MTAPMFDDSAAGGSPSLPGEQLTSLLVEDTLLPVQFFGRFCGGRRYTGEERLMLGVLEDAVNVYCGYYGRQGRAGLREVREVERWFASTDLSYVFAFERICQVLDLDPGYIRRGLSWVRAQQRRQRPLVISESQLDTLRAAMGG